MCARGCACMLPVLLLVQKIFVTSLTDISMLCFQTECKPFRSCKAEVTSDYLALYLYRVLCALITVSSLGFHGDDFCEIFVLWAVVWFIIGDTCFCFLQWILIWIRWSDCDRTQAKQRYSSWCSSSLGDLRKCTLVLLTFKLRLHVCAQCRCRLSVMF